MREILDEIKGALELELALGGSDVPTEPTDEPVAPRQKESTAPPQTANSTNKPVPAPAPTPAAPGSLFNGGGSTRDRFESLIESESPLLGFDTLDEVARWVAETVLIPLDEIRLNPVFGVGNPNADLMVIGEAPGADEDRQGEPFVGRAGQLLNKILEAIDFARSDVYIANILKSRPPNNRNPYPAEIEAHIPILFKQIALIQPKLILCVGKISGTSLLQRDVSLGSLRGQFHDFHGIPLMVTYHPAALLRNPQWKKATWEDVQQLREKYDALVGISEEGS